MKKLLFAAIAVPLMNATALAAMPVTPQPSATLMLGIAAEFGDGAAPEVGFTAKILSTNKPNSFVLGAGITFFPWAESNNLGLDLDAGVILHNVAILGGYDLLRQQLQVSGGWAPTMKEAEEPLPVSDARLKRDIRLLTMREDGLRLYSFKYLWSDEEYVGLMAQDLLADPARMDAVKPIGNGFYGVNYAALGLRMTTLADWQAHGMEAVTLH